MSFAGGSGSVKVGAVEAMGGEAIGFDPLLDDLIAVDDVVYVIVGTMENDGGDNAGEAAHGVVGDLSLSYRVGATFAFISYVGRWVARCLIFPSTMHSHA